jgi:hypothetical protein
LILGLKDISLELHLGLQPWSHFMSDGAQIHERLVRRNQHRKLAVMPAAIAVLKGGRRAGDRGRVENTEADTVAPEGGVSAAVHRKVDGAVGIATHNPRPCETDLVLAVSGSKGDAEVVAMIVDDQVVQDNGGRPPILVTHGDIYALDNLFAGDAQLAQITIAEVQ